MYMSRKVRTQLYLEKRQKRLLEEQSEATGKSVGQLVREAVDQVYERRFPPEAPLSPDDPLWDIVGTAKSKVGDLSSRHDYYLYIEPYEQRDKKRRKK